MYSQLFVEMEHFQFTKTGQAACGDDIQMKVLKGENRYRQLLKKAPTEAESIFAEAEEDAKRRMAFYKKMGEIM